MKVLKDNIYYKKLRRWFKNRKKSKASRVIWLRRAPFYLRPIRYWLGKITVRNRDSLRSSLPHRTRVAGQHYHHTIKRNRRRSRQAQIPESGTQPKHSVGGSPHSSSYQDSRKTILPAKNRLQGISWSSQQHSPYEREFTRLFYYVFKNTLIPVSAVQESGLSNLIISLTKKLPFIGLLALVTREINWTNLMIFISSSKQIIVDHSIWFIKNKMLKILQSSQFKNNKLNRPSGQDSNKIPEEIKNEKIDLINCNNDVWQNAWVDTWEPDSNNWLLNFNWNDKKKWPSRDQGYGKRRLNYFGNWDNYDEGDFADYLNNSKDKNKKEKTYTLRRDEKLRIKCLEICQALESYFVNSSREISFLKIEGIIQKFSDNRPTKSFNILEIKDVLTCESYYPDPDYIWDHQWSEKDYEILCNLLSFIIREKLHEDEKDEKKVIENGNSNRLFSQVCCKQPHETLYEKKLPDDGSFNVFGSNIHQLSNIS